MCLSLNSCPFSEAYNLALEVFKITAGVQKSLDFILLVDTDDWIVILEAPIVSQSSRWSYPWCWFYKLMQLASCSLSSGHSSRGERTRHFAPIICRTVSPCYNPSNFTLYPTVVGIVPCQLAKGTVGKPWSNFRIYTNFGKKITSCIIVSQIHHSFSQPLTGSSNMFLYQFHPFSIMGKMEGVYLTRC